MRFQLERAVKELGLKGALINGHSRNALFSLKLDPPSESLVARFAS